MVKDFKYIIKRIIIGVGIALALMFIKGNLLIGVNAQEISSYTWGYHGDNINDDTSNFAFTINTNPWANWRTGYLYFTFSINSVSPATNDPISVRSVVASSDTVNYICNVGSTNNTGGTYNSTTYSAKCPMDLGWPGLTGITVNFNVVNSGTNALYHIEFSSQATFEQTSSVTLSTTDTTNAINNQITNDNTNTTNIINNQNTNTQQQIESQQVCNSRELFYNDTDKSGRYLTTMGGFRESSNWGVTDFIAIGLNPTITLSNNFSDNVGSVCFYNITKDFISCVGNTNSTLTIPNNSYYVRFSIRNSDQPLILIKSCQNGNQAISDSQQEINNSITSTDGVADNDIESLFQDLDISSDTPISDLLTMPITLVQAYINGVGGSCQSVNLGSLYGTNLIIPCIDLQARLGSGLWNLIDVLFSLFMIYNIAMLIINIFDKVTSLDDTFSFFTKGGDM